LSLNANFLTPKKPRKTGKETKKKKPIFGCAKGEIYISPDFDEPLKDFKEYSIILT